MNLRIISGALRGRRISLPEKQVTFRPTKDRVRQSLAETIKEKIPGAAAADFCAGSGAFGIELASRGAAKVHFVERDRVLARSLSTAIDSLGIIAQCSVFNKDIVTFVRQCSFSYDIIFFDPPYENEELAALVAEMIPLLSRNGILLYEYSPRRKKLRLPFEFSDLKNVLVETKAYGDTAVDIFRFGS
jgi:16S rRNA (guanine966-N2)-methyltransferase